ncbi:uncharacterized protein LOC110117567 [Ceratitis capitata]|uniref:uncharacterized protein LOC110117567 n=1 Tax=Ceratitis capitata TaxID=7213 RepID=UPI00032A2BFB|nr:uncharacterized protein LOC110117567 [Ceratitis capitata]
MQNKGSAVIEKGVQLSCSGPAEQHSSPRSVQAGAQITALGMPPMDTTPINHSPLFCTTAVAVTVANTSVQFSSPHSSMPVELRSMAMAPSQQLGYAGAPMAPNQFSPCDRRSSLLGGPQMNSTFAHPSACVFGQSRHAPISTAGTDFGGNVVNAPQPSIPSLSTLYARGCSAAAQNPFYPVHDSSGLPHGGATPIDNRIWREAHTQFQPSLDLSLSPSHIATRQVISKDLPSFSGKPEERPLFITNYEQSTERCGFSEQENLIRLQKSLRGAALEAVRDKLTMPSTIHLAIDTLRMLFGRPDVIHNRLQRKLRQMPAVRTDRLNTLIDLALGVQNYRATMQALALNEYLNDPMLINELLCKLPGDMKLDWGRRRMATSRNDIVTFDEWLFALASCASQVTPLSDATSAEEKIGRRGNRERVFMHGQINHEVDSTKSCKDNMTFLSLCPQCNKDHNLSACPDFREMSRNELWQLIKDRRLCNRCFKAHMMRRCNSRRVCGVDNCRMAHNPLLPNQTTNLNAQSNIDNSTILLHQRKSKRTIFRYIPVILYGPRATIEVFALIDERASCTLMDSRLADQLGLDGPSEELCLKWTGGICQQEANSKYISCEISARGKNSTRYRLRNMRTITDLELPQQSLNADTLNAHEHLKSLPILPYTDCKARLLIGLDNTTKLCVPAEVLQAENGDLIAVRCKLGWSVYGHDNSTHMPAESLLYVCSCNKDNQLDSLMRTYFAVDSVGISPAVKPLTSKADERAYHLMEKTVKYNADDKNGKQVFCGSTTTSIYLTHTEWLSTVSNGYVRRLKADEVSRGGKSWFIPIFTVLNVNKNKRRIVWDAAAKVSDTSLNDVRLKGLDLLRSLVGILMRFRERSVAICGDIREMFHQIRVKEEDQVAQQFLWRNGDVHRRPDVFAMTTLHKAVATIVSNTFVDDWLHSTDNEDEMVQLASDVRNIHSVGGFEMRNWLSNSKRVLQAMTSQSKLAIKCFLEPGSELQKVLGMWWLPISDELTFVHKFKPEVFNETRLPIKRQILRLVTTIFDPLGLLGFFVIQAKMFLQDVWRSGVAWDEPVQDRECSAWWQWLRRLHFVCQIRIPRCYQLASHSSDNQLHAFVDASISAYAAVAFIRSSIMNKIYCSLVASKTRVAPLKPLSVPRLELMAAILGLRLAKFIEQEVSININRRIFWSDSKDVLCWIRSDTRKFNQFVAVRVGEILEDSQVNEWRWVPSKDNVADDGTKWTPNMEINSAARWFTGPDFLKLSETSWPTINFEQVKTAVEIVQHMNTYNTPKHDPSPDPQRCYSMTQLVQVLKFFYFVNASKNEYGLLRVKGRIDEAREVPADLKRPIILPRNSIITHLITEFYHRRFHHHHNEIVINEMRQRFCVHGLRSLVRNVTKLCQHCCNRRAMPNPPETGKIPMERLATFCHPFAYTGVDYFGQFDVTVGRKHEKRWGVVFTYNGTNFRGASRILAEEIEKILSETIMRKYPEIEWKFIPPASPHMGDAWERMVRSIKSVNPA